MLGLRSRGHPGAGAETLLSSRACASFLSLYFFVHTEKCAFCSKERLLREGRGPGLASNFVEAPRREAGQKEQKKEFLSKSFQSKEREQRAKNERRFAKPRIPRDEWAGSPCRHLRRDFANLANSFPYARGVEQIGHSIPTRCWGMCEMLPKCWAGQASFFLRFDSLQTGFKSFDVRKI